MRRMLVIAAMAGVVFAVALLVHVILTVAADGTGPAAGMAQATCAGCHRT
jgi:hypothetical protein